MLRSDLVPTHPCKEPFNQPATQSVFQATEYCNTDEHDVSSFTQRHLFVHLFDSFNVSVASAEFKHRKIDELSILRGKLTFILF